MNKFALALWRLTRWIPGAFQVSQAIYRTRFRATKKKLTVKDRPDRAIGFSGLAIIAPEANVNGRAMTASPGNPYFELWASALERDGAERVFALPDSLLGGGVEEVLRVVNKFKVSHIVLNPESPDNPATWELPSALCAISEQSRVTFWFVLFDSVHWDHIFKLNWIGDKIAKGVVLPIDRKIGKKLNRSLFEANSQCLPISDSTISKIPKVTEQNKLVESISFLGKIYEYRERLFSHPAYQDIEVNPHISGEVRPSYTEFLDSMAKYVGTLNLSRASSYPKSQLKSRVLEAAIVGCPIVTDDAGLAAQYLGSQHLVVTARNKGQLETLLGNGEALRLLGLVDRRKLMDHARTIAPISFWQSFEKADGQFISI